ncbi:RING finger protein 44 [Schistosoma japonicum]|nr:RING finger protein 44 [Schistosoma japonicum]
MHTSSEQNAYIGEQVSSFTDQTTSRRFSRPHDQSLQYNNLTPQTITFNRMLNHGITMPVSGTWCPTEFGQPDFLLLQPTPKRRRTSSGSTGLSRRYCTSSRNSHFSGGLPIHSSRNQPHMREIANHRFIRSLDSRNSDNFCQRNIFMNPHPVHQHWPQVLPTSQHPNHWQSELQQVTGLVSVAAVAAAAAAAATQDSAHYQQSFMSPTTTVSFSEVIPCSSSKNYVAIAQQAQGFATSRPSLVKRPNYQFSFSNGIGSTKRRSYFPEANETHGQIVINNSHSYHGFAVTNKDIPLPSPSSFSSSLTSALLNNSAHLSSCPADAIDSVSSCTTHSSLRSANNPSSENTVNCSPPEYNGDVESPNTIIPADLIHRSVVEQLDLLTMHPSHPVLSSHSIDHNDLLSFTYVTNCDSDQVIGSNVNSNDESSLELIECQQQPLICTMESNIDVLQGDNQSTSMMINKSTRSYFDNGLNTSVPGASETTTSPHYNIEENTQFVSPCFPHSELNGTSANFVMSSSPTTQSHEEATVVAAAVVASAAAHAVAAAAQAVSAAVQHHHRRTSEHSSLQAFSPQLRESVLMHAIPNQSTINPLTNCMSSQPNECNSSHPANRLISTDLSNSYNDHGIFQEHGFSYRQSQLMTRNVLNSSLNIQPNTVFSLSSSQPMYNPSNLCSSEPVIDRNNNFTCDPGVNLHIPNICAGFGQLASSSMLHSIIPTLSSSNSLALIRSTNEFVNNSYPLGATVAHVTSEANDNNLQFTLHTSEFTGSQIPGSHVISTPLTFSNHVQPTLLNSSFSTPPLSPSYYQSPIYPNLATEVAVAVATNQSSSAINRCTDPIHLNHFLPNNIVSLSPASSYGSSCPSSFSPYLPPTFSSVTPIPLLPLRPPPQLSIINPSTLATTGGVNTLLQFLRLIHQRPDSYALPYYPSAMTATAGGSNQSVVVSASAGVASGTRVASAVTPPLVPHHHIPPQTSFLSTCTDGHAAARSNLFVDSQQTSIPSSVSIQPITSAAAALAAAMAAAVALQQQNHRYAPSNAMSMLTPSRAAPTPSIPVPILHAHLYYPRNVATMQQLHNAHQQCYHTHYGRVQHQNSVSQRPASISNASASSFQLPLNSVNPLLAAASAGVSATSPAYLTSLFPFLLAVPTAPPSLPNSSSSVNDLSETLLAHYADQSVEFSNGNSILSQTVSDPTSAATAAAAAAAVAAAAAAASVDTLLHLAVQLESNNGRGISKDELESLPIRLYTLKSPNRLPDDKQKSSFDETQTTNAQNYLSECDRCMICLDDYVESQQIRQMRCLHEFHASCVDKWLKTKRTCPLCRADAFTGSQHKDDYF